MFKKSFTELFYLALLLTALRPPQNRYYNPHERLYRFTPTDPLGPITAEYLNEDCFNDYFYSSKNSFLLNTRYDLLEDINSLGRYSRPLLNSNVLAFPVSHVNSDDQDNNNNNNPLSLLDNYDSHLPQLPLDIFESDSSDDELEEETRREEARREYIRDAGERGVNGRIQDEPIDLNNNPSPSIFHFGNNNTDLNDRTPSIDLLNDVESGLLPLLDSDNAADLNEWFGELEDLLQNDESYGPESSWSYYPSVAPTTDYAQVAYEPPLNADIRNLDNANLYDTNSTHQIVSNPSGSTANFSAVLYTSLSTLSNGDGGEHNMAMVASSTPTSSSASGLLYNSTEVTEYAYMNNSLNGSASFYNYFGDDQYHLSNNATNDSANYSHYPDTQPTSVNFIAPASNGATLTPGNQFTTTTTVNGTTTTEDCFDKNSDSAVSSMSSDRVHSFSDNDWPETSSESSSFAEGNLTDYHSNESKTSAQKKYRFFGKTKLGDNVKTTNTSMEPSAEYYVDYGHHYLYAAGACPTSNEHGYEQQASYHAFHNNHTYAQPVDIPVPLHHAQPDGAQWNDDSATIKKEEDDSFQSQLAGNKQVCNKKQQQSHYSHKSRDPHLNRDEKRARTLKIPISTADIINLPIDEFNERLTKYELTEMQLSLIRDIRRRGKNKVAAQNCRKRKLDQIMGLQTEVDSMFSEKDSLEAEYNHMMMLRELARSKYTKLYHFVLESSSSRQQFFELTASPSGFPDKDNNNTQQHVHAAAPSGNASHHHHHHYSNTTSSVLFGSGCKQE